MSKAVKGKVWLLEKKLGITRGTTGFAGWDWGPDVMREYTQQCYLLNIGPVYMQRRFNFLLSLNRFLRDQLASYQADKGLVSQNRDLKPRLAALQDRLDNDFHLAASQLHQVTCLEKRIQTQMETVSFIRPVLGFRVRAHIIPA